jgi:hypothetical protein
VVHGGHDRLGRRGGGEASVYKCGVPIVQWQGRARRSQSWREKEYYITWIKRVAALFMKQVSFEIPFSFQYRKFIIRLVKRLH